MIVLKIVCGLVGYFVLTLMIGMAASGLSNSNTSFRDLVKGSLIVMVAIPVVVGFFWGIVYIILL